MKESLVIDGAVDEERISDKNRIDTDQPRPTGKIVDPKTEDQEGMVQTSFLGEQWIGSHHIVEQEVRNDCVLPESFRGRVLNPLRIRR